MLNTLQSAKQPEHHRNRRREKRLWHDGRNRTPSLGCTGCADRELCGGLCLERAFYDCYDYCCGNAEKCDAVCRNKPREFAKRVREVGSFRLDNVPRADRLPEPVLPPVVPVLLHGYIREAPFAPSAVCVPLDGVIARHRGEERHTDASALADAYCFQRATRVMLTGTAEDAPLERWWSLGPARLDAIRRLRDLRVELVTTPNFSMFTDRPRWDDMHSMKRIALTHEEFLREGVPAALHVNARTERDWERWTEYIRQRSEVTHVAFDFNTRAGWAGRIDWQVAQLTALSQGVGRSLHLIVRAPGRGILPRLVRAFGGTTVLDTTSFMKAVNRQRAVRTINGKIGWETCRTPRDGPVDELLAHNWSLVRRSFDLVLGATQVRKAE